MAVVTDPVDRPRVRVVKLATTLPAAVGDGTPEFVLSLAQHIPDARVEIVAPRSRGCAALQQFGPVEVHRFAYAPRRVERLADEAILPTLRTDRWTWLQVPGLVLAMWRTAARRARSGDVDVLVAHWIVPAGLIARWVGRRRGIPYVVVAHGADAYALHGRLLRRVKRAVLRDAAGVHAVSSEIASRLDALAPGCVTMTMPVGVEVGPEPIGSERVPGMVLFVGRLAEKKGVDVLLRAMAQLDAHCTLEVVGDGPERADLERLAASLGIADRVRFAGALPHHQVREALRSAALVVVPSRTARDGDRDGTPVVLMEAMAHGAPVVASAIGGIAEVVADGDTALLVPESDPAALAEAITSALADPDAAMARARRARRVAEEQLDVAAVGARLGQEIDRAAGLGAESVPVSA